MSDERKYWFPMKTYGWGWGPPATWQGWVVLALFVVLLAAGAFLFPPDRQVGWFLAWTGFLVAGLLAVCWWKGEPPRWRWGGD